VRQAIRTELGPATWMTVVVSISASAVSKAELPLPMISTFWSR
jgi:hypothetical protein